MSRQRERRKKAGQSALGEGVEPLQGRNVLLHGSRRTSMRLEPSMWAALDEIAQKESLSINDLCTRIDLRLAEQAKRRGIDPEASEVTLTSGVRVFIFAYYRAAATPEGHSGAGHGLGDPFIGTPFARKNDDGGGESSEDGGGAPPDVPPNVQSSQSKAAEAVAN